MAGGFQHRSMANESVFPPAEFRDSYESPPESQPAKPPKHSFAELMAIAGYEPEPEPKPVKKAKPDTEGKESRSSNHGFVVKGKEEEIADEYNPEQPLMVGEPQLKYPKEKKGKAVAEAGIAERAATPSYKYNPHLVEHLVAGASYTKDMCKTCARDRKCRRHRSVYEAETGVSLCAHTYVTLIWAVDDPANEKGSWKVEIKDYGLDTDIARWEHANDCKPYRPSERVGMLARRLVDDLGDERIMGGVGPRRGNVGRAERKIRTLVAAWERVQVVRKAREEKKKKKKKKKKRKVEEKREKSERKAQKMLKEMLRKVHGIEEQRKENDFTRKQREFRDADAATQANAEMLSEVVTEKIPPTSPCPPSTIMGPLTESETLELDTNEIYELNVDEPDTLKTSAPASPLGSVHGSTTASPELAGYKRKRNSDSGSASSSSTKRVRFTPEIEAASIVQKPRLRRLRLPYEADVEIEEEVAGRTEVIVEEEVIVKETVGAEGGEEVAVKESTPSLVEDSKSTLDLVKSCF
jgi:hypothetical protein